MKHEQMNSTASPDALYKTRAGMVVDPKRFQTADAILFKPLRVQETISLALLLEQGKIQPTAQVGVAQVTAMISLAFRVEQLAYHHVIQGDAAGEPWMVSF